MLELLGTSQRQAGFMIAFLSMMRKCSHFSGSAAGPVPWPGQAVVVVVVGDANHREGGCEWAGMGQDPRLWGILVFSRPW